MTAQQLKNSILQMAVQGKLVPQDPNDEPASVLLERIRKEKEKMIKEGKIKKEKNPSIIFRGEDNLPYEKVGKNEPVCIADEVPFEIPESWEWCRLNDIVIKDIKRGKSPKYTDKSSVFVFAQKCNVKTGGINISLAKYLDMNAFAKYPEEEYMRDKDIVVNSTGNGTLGRIGIFRDSDRLNDNIIVPDSHVTVIRSNSEICCDYVLCVLEYYQPSLEKQGEGSTNQTELKPGVLADLYFPLPPYEEQKRIVHSLIALKEYIEKYKLKENKLTQLNTEFPSLLKKSILQQAVMGKLVSQDPNDEPASVLLEKIRTEKEVLIKAGKLKKDKHESIIYRRDNSHYEKLDGVERCIDNEIPFDIPDSWCWSRLSSILYKLTDGTHSTPKYTESGIPFLSVKDVSSGKISFENCKYISEKEHNELYERCNPEKGDILLTKVGTTGIPVIVDTDICFSLFVSVALLKLDNTLLDINYLVHLINSPLVQLQAKENTRGVGNKNWVMRDIANTLIVIPPLEEQHRIVNKIETLSNFMNNL